MRGRATQPLPPPPPPAYAAEDEQANIAAVLGEAGDGVQQAVPSDTRLHAFAVVDLGKEHKVHERRALAAEFVSQWTEESTEEAGGEKT